MKDKSIQGIDECSKTPDQLHETEIDLKRSRRDAISRIGKYSAYAVPALLALASKPSAASPV